jgi:putative membrane-bound dehydrogenase-like protein
MMLRTRLAAPALILVVAFAAVAHAAEPSGRLKVLFLGDRGHHVPAERAAQLVPALAARGIDVTYTERVDDLNPENLKRYDAVIVYANIDAIRPAPMKALLDYVEGGGGFVPIHCASFCFRNAPEYVALVGAQFQRHGTGTFDTKVVVPDHPIVRGLEPFRTWDETYVHTLHNPKDRVVLQVRAEGDAEEPWTWVRTQGKGRVFYTAYGHDNRTWGHPGFVDLVERGIRWAANKTDVYDSRPRAARGLKPLEYQEAGAEIPNYLPSQRWGTQGEPIRTMQKPLDPAESIRHLAVPRGFTPRLFAAEPQIAKPICMTWDHTGRLFIAESVDYPNTKHPGVGRDKISVLEDTDGDGAMDRSSVFAEGLNIPTSLLCYDGGLIVLQAPETLYLKDTDGDGKADLKKVLFAGWGTGDTHAGPSNLRWGLDNWVYGIVGYSAFNGDVGGEHHRFSQGFYRFRPDGSRLEFLRSTNNNSWGVGFSEEGLLFGSTANGCPSVYVPIPNRYYEKLRGGSAAVLQIIADTNRFFPITDKVRQVDWHGGFTAGAGHALYTARAYPSYYWNKTAFVAEPTGHLVATFALQKKGTDFAAHNAWNLVASDDEWTAPINAEVGPDGHVWVIDWYNYIVQHNPTPRGFKTGRGAAYETPLRDKTHGRIYRIVYDDAKPSTPPKLDPADPRGLVAALSNDNMFWRLHAQRLLVERGKADVVPELVKLVEGRTLDALGLDPGAIHALWTLHGLNALKDGPGRAAAVAALGYPSAGVRRNAALALAGDDDAAARVVAAGLLKDEEPLVRLAALQTIADAPPSAASARALAAALRDGVAEGDRWLPDALTVAAAVNDAGFLRAVAESKGPKPLGDKALTIVGRVAEHYARGAPGASVGALVVALGEADPRLAEAVVAGLTRGWPKDKTATLDDKADAAFGRLLERLPAGSKGPLIGLASRLGSKKLEKFAAETAANLLKTAEDDSKSEADRLAAAGQLAELVGTGETAKALLALITPRTPPSLGVGLVEAVARGHDEAIAAALLEALPAMTPAVRTAALGALLGRADWTPALVKAIEAGAVRLDALSLDQKQALADHPDRALAGRARRLLARGGGLPDPDRQKVIDELAPIVLKGGDAARGKVVFEQQCAKCHSHSGAGGKVGPDLTGMAAHPRDELLVHILDPSRSVEGNFVQYTAATTDGRVLNGLLASETKTAVELLDAEGKTHVLPRSEIDELVASKKSLMPEGFEKQVPREALTDLLAFLTARGKYLPLDLRKAATVVSTKGIVAETGLGAGRLVFPDWSPKVVDGVPFALVDPQGDRIPNAVLLYGPRGAIPQRMPKSVTLPVNAPAKAIHLLSGVSGLGFPLGREGSVSMIVRITYADGTTEDHELKNGVHFANFNGEQEVPGSKLAFKLGGQQVRYLVVTPRKKETIAGIELVKGPDQSAPIVLAATVEGFE